MFFFCFFYIQYMLFVKYIPVGIQNSFIGKVCSVTLNPENIITRLDKNLMCSMFWTLWGLSKAKSGCFCWRGHCKSTTTWNGLHSFNCRHKQEA